MFRTRLVQTAGVLVGVVALTAMVSSSASASGTVTLHSKATGRCLDSNTSGTAYAIACNGGTYQSWIMGSFGGNDQYLQDSQTGRCLTTGTQANSNLVYMKTVTPCADNAVNFLVVANSDGTKTFKAGTWCLDSNTNGEGNNVGAIYIDPCNGGNYQRFTVK
ncbi:Ricin B lectin [Catenulispora acidiphila DSM 44928]|uniref:Ricin B lectin n=1 Tax=Catenulispora acidiphila (strain DSM 44928 / JCM 14897 / NBRC 102108 / NRRL B-24433 / ID139908) TaxID=479433 RepID=C7PYH4_CATAD|nr:RICIN domain-containing protein [Catenulispora acidiphila]ACU75464.1 Ricin B lectin [Catenulispora acidiphila DSM 44928]